MKTTLIITLLSIRTLYANDFAEDVYNFCNDCNTNRNGVSMQSIANWGFVDWHTNHPEFKAIVNTISNDYTQVLCSLSQFQTNEYERAVLFTAIPYAGFTAWTNVLNGMISIAETNQTACPTEWIFSMSLPASTPYEYYIAYHYMDAPVSNSLVRMINLINTDNDSDGFLESYQTLQSGEFKQFLIEAQKMPTNSWW